MISDELALVDLDKMANALGRVLQYEDLNEEEMKCVEVLHQIICDTLSQVNSATRDH